MKKNSIISVVNEQNLYYEKNKIELISLGTYTQKNGKYYIIYKDSVIDKYDNVENLCSIRVENPDLIIISRIGLIKSNLTLEKGKRNYGQCKTDFGTITMGIYTEYIKCDMGKSSAKISLKYFMDIESDLVSSNKISINVKENDEKNVKCTDNGD